MADATKAIAATLVHEGGYVDNPNDSGGATNMGITQADMPGQDMRALTVAQATAYYLAHYWKPSYSQISDQALASKLFDMGVLFGVGEAAYLLQRALNFLPGQWTKLFDAPTLLATNEANPVALLAQYKEHLFAHARNVATANAHDAGFLIGWTRRINS